MATGPGVNLGKTDFVKSYLKDHRDAGVDAVKEAWTAAGNDGTVSESLVNKMRQKLGLTGGKSVRTETASGGVAARAEKSERTPTAAGRVAHQPSKSEVSTKKAAVTRHGDDEDALDELEEGLDELIQKIRDLGGRPDVVKALRRARRLLVRSHEG